MAKQLVVIGLFAQYTVGSESLVFLFKQMYARDAAFVIAMPSALIWFKIMLFRRNS